MTLLSSAGEPAAAEELSRLIKRSDDLVALKDIVQRIVRVTAPRRIILFGSTARGEARPDSDFDVLIVASEETHRGHVTERIYRALIGVGRSVDVVVATPGDIERYRNSPSLVLATALREGVDIYAAA